MSTHRTCPSCKRRTLTIRRGVGGLLLLCSGGCTREQIVAALPNEATGSTLDRAARIVELLLRAAVDTPDELPEHVDALTGAQVRAALLLMVHFDRERQPAGVRVSIDLEALDRLSAAADEGPGALHACVLDLAERDARAALVELLLLHRDLAAIKALARNGATNN